MKRASAAVLLTVAVVGVVAASSPAAVHSRLTRAQAVKRLHKALGARPTQVQLVWADVALKRVVLEWMAYSAHARIRPVSWPMGAPEPKTYHGPARAWLGADGGTTGRRRRGPAQTPSRAALRVHRGLAPASTQAQHGISIRLAPLRPQPRVGEGIALQKLASAFAGVHATPHRLWLVRATRLGRGARGTHAIVLNWMAVGRGPDGPVVGLLDASTGDDFPVERFHR